MASESLLSFKDVLFLGLLFKACGYIARDELVLRLLVVLGLACDITFYATLADPIFPPIISNTILMSINLFVVSLVLLERTTFAMSAREKGLYAAFPALSPGQFRKISRLARYEENEAEVRILTEGAPVERLYYIEGDLFFVAKGGSRAAARGHAFAGEIGLLTDRPASASVDLPAGTPHVVWDISAVKALINRNRSIRNALVAQFALDLAGKVAFSIPAPRPQTAPEPLRAGV